ASMSTSRAPDAGQRDRALQATQAPRAAVVVDLVHDAKDAKAPTAECRHFRLKRQAFQASVRIEGPLDFREPLHLHLLAHREWCESVPGSLRCPPERSFR